MSIVDFGELSKPATILIEKISDGVGGIFKPYQMRRVANAHADIAVIEAESQIKVTGMQRRGLERLAVEEGIKQENIENITLKAIPKLDDTAAPEALEKDWLMYLFDKARLTSDEEMQTLWAGILAGEANKAGSFSRRTIDLVAKLDKDDAELFTQLCTFCWTIDGDVHPLIYYHEAGKLYKDSKVNFMTLSHLQSIGLITYGLYKCENLVETIEISYFGKQLFMIENQADDTLDIGKILFTQAGQELESLCASKGSDVFYHATVEHFFLQEKILYTPLPDSA